MHKFRVMTMTENKSQNIDKTSEQGNQVDVFVSKRARIKCDTCGCFVKKIGKNIYKCNNKICGDWIE